MRNRANEQNGISALQVYLYANAAIFLGTLYLSLPNRTPSSFDYDYSAYQRGDAPYGNHPFSAAATVTFLVNILGLAVYGLLDCCRDQPQVAANPAALFNGAQQAPKRNPEVNQTAAPALR